MTKKRDDNAQPDATVHNRRGPRGQIKPLAKVGPSADELGGSVGQRTSRVRGGCYRDRASVEVVCNDNAGPDDELTDAEITLVTWLIRQELKKWER